MPVGQNDILEISIMADFDGVEDLVNVGHVYVFQGTNVPNEDALDDIEFWVRAILDSLKLLMSGLVIWRKIVARRVQDGYLVGERILNPTVAGNSAVTPLPPGNAVLTLLRTGIAGVVGKKYGGVAVQSQLTADGKYNSGVVAAQAAAWTTYASTVTGGNMTFTGGVYSRKTGLWHWVTSIETSAIPSYQRRRRQGRGS